MNTPNNKTLILIDGHVHFHDCFDLPRFLSSAYTNFRDVAEQQGVPNHFIGVLMLTEIARAGWFKRLSALADGEHTTESTTKGDWNFRRTSESSSLLAERGQHECLFPHDRLSDQLGGLLHKGSPRAILRRSAFRVLYKMAAVLLTIHSSALTLPRGRIVYLY